MQKKHCVWMAATGLQIFLGFLAFKASFFEKLLKWDATNRVSLMTFNVENLFDTIDNPFKNDQTYLPLSLKKSAEHRKSCKKLRFKKWQKDCLELDWNEKALSLKLSKIAKTIRSTRAPQGPDLLMLQEVENLDLLERLNNEFLGDLNYSAFLVEGNDPRGINIGVLSRLKIVNAGELNLFKETRVLRSLLKVEIQMPSGDTVWILGVHLPSGYSNSKERLRILQKIDEIRSKNPAQEMFLMGDFNISHNEELKSHTIARTLGYGWNAAHRHCLEYRNCSGTYPKKKPKSFFDMIFHTKTPRKWSFWPPSVETLLSEASDHRAFYVELIRLP